MQTTIEARPDPEQQSIQKSHLGFPVVGIGASAGGLAALQRLLENMPATTGMAFVVVVHLAPEHESSMAEILQKSTRMPVQQVSEPTPVQANHVYIISPAKNLSMNDGYLRVSQLVRPQTRHTAIDIFFRTLAQAHQERAVAVVLSGMGADGTQGLKRVKELGGVSLVQSPDDAEYDSMPRSAMATGAVDWTLPVIEMPQKLVELWGNARHIQLPEPPADLETDATSADQVQLAETALAAIKALLRQRTGHDFSHYKRATVLRRLERRMQVNTLPDLQAYRRFLESNPQETPALLQDMLISVTNFFRDRDAFESLERQLTQYKTGPEGAHSLRAWVAGCATGEEAYSVAILLDELAKRDLQQEMTVQVFASDIDKRAVDIGRAGLYPESIGTDITPARLRDDFTQEPGGYRITKRIRDTLLFSNQNVLRDPPFTRLDLMCCRNLLIYLDRDAQLQLLRTFHFCLKPGGLLFLGNSESADAADGLFTVVDKKQRIYRAAPGAPKARAALINSAAFTPLSERPPKPREPSPPRLPLQELHERILARQAPPSVVIDADHTVLHVSEGAAHLLRISAGAPSNKLLDLVRSDLRIELRTALFRAVETGRSVEAKRVKLIVNGSLHYVGMSVRPVVGETVAGLLLVLFDETEESLVAEEGAASDVKDPVVQSLEAELLEAKKALQATAGESAASTEELRASNEELQTINEELRSTTEELETSREELQSVNEELITVNQELQSKIDESDKVNDDLNNLIASTDVGTVFIDRGLRLKRYTPSVTTLFNLIASDVGRPLLDIRHRLDYPQLAEDVHTVFKTLQTVEQEVPTDDGRWLLVRVLPYRTNEDRIDGAILNFIDVTRRHEIEGRLREAEQRMRRVAESMRDFAIITMDVDGMITSWNGGAERIFGYTSTDIIGRPAELIFVDRDRASGVVQQEMRLARDNGRAEDDRWHLRKNGTTFFCSGVMTPLHEDGRMIGYAKIARDLTHSRLLNAQRASALEAETLLRHKLEEASTQKDEFLAVMSHELKNPLNLVMLNADLLLRQPQARAIDSVVRAANTIRKAVASQSQIIDDLLDMSRLNTGKLVLTPQPMSLNPIIEHIISAMQIDAHAKQQTVQLEMQAEMMVNADSVRVEQIVWNLVTNAVKFTPTSGTIRVTLTREDGFARLDVSDTGIGLPAGQTDAVFEMFRQVDNGSNRTRGGLGIGLALVKRLAELHGGRVSAASPGLGQGSTFSVWLPLNDQLELAQPLQRSSQGLEGLRILVVDDESDTGSTFGELLKLEGSLVTVVSAAEQALEMAKTQPFDLLLSDLAMPGHDGYWLVNQLKADDSTSQLRAIAVSGMARQGDRQKALAAGFDEHLGKPLQIETLKEIVEHLKTVPHT